jgi:ADP-ribose pyrophosphatase YjhB (NUDIX family)
MQTAFAVRRLLLRWLRIRTRGVKVMLFNKRGELLLVRHNYGNTGVWLIPGGGIKRKESPEAAAVREVHEELGVDARELVLVSVHVSRAEGRRDTIHLFKGVTDEEPRPDGIEVSEARFFSPEALPERVSAATLRRIAEIRGEREADPGW